MAFYDDPYIVGPILFMFICVMGYLYLKEKHNHAEAMAQPQVKNGSGGLKTTPLFDLVPWAMSELEKIGEEQKVIATKFGLNEEQFIELRGPLKKRYEMVKFMKDNEGFTVPLLNIGQKFINNVLKGL